MQKPLSILLLTVFFSACLDAQTLPVKVLPKEARALLKDYVLIPEGEFIKNLHMGYDTLLFQPIKKTLVDSFYMSRYEITVEEYIRFYKETGDMQNKYDSAVWVKDFPYSFNELICRRYFNTPEYRTYPVVGVTWEQVIRFCAWKSQELNRLLEQTGYQVAFSLPTDAEWQYAAIGPAPQVKEGPVTTVQRYFPWGASFFYSKSPKDGFHVMCNSGNTTLPQDFSLFSYHVDGGLYTMPVASFEPNGFGLYQMSGNVAEWTMDNFSTDYKMVEGFKRQPMANPQLIKYIPTFPPGTYDDYKIVKGGSWVDEMFYMQIGVHKIQRPDVASSTVGFRPVLRIFRK